MYPYGQMGRGQQVPQQQMMYGQQQQPNMMMNNMYGQQQPNNMMMGRGGMMQQPNQMMGQPMNMMNQQQPNMMMNMGRGQPNMMMNQQQQMMNQPNMMNMNRGPMNNNMMGQQNNMMMMNQQQQQQQQKPQQMMNQPNNNMMMNQQQQQPQQQMMYNQMNQQQPQQQMMMNQPQPPQKEEIFQPPEELKAIPNLPNKWARSVDYDPQNQIISIGSNRGGQLVQFQTGKLIQELPEVDGETYLRFIGNNTYVICCTHLRDMILIYQPNLTGQGRPVIKTIQHGCQFGLDYWCIEKMTEDGKQVAVSLDKAILIIDTEQATILSKLEKPSCRVKSLVCLPKRGVLCSGVSRQYKGQNEGNYLETDCEIYLWNVSMGTSKMFRPSMDVRNRSNSKGVQALCIHPSKNELIGATGDYDTFSQIWVYSLDTLGVLQKMDFLYPLSVSDQEKKKRIQSMSVMGNYVVIGMQGSIKIFSLRSYQCVHTLQGCHDQGGFVYDIRVKLDQGLFFTPSNKMVKIWEIPQNWMNNQNNNNMIQQQPIINQQPQQQPMMNQPQNNMMMNNQQQQFNQQQQQQPVAPTPVIPQQSQQPIVNKQPQPQQMQMRSSPQQQQQQPSSSSSSGQPPTKLYGLGTDGNIYVLSSNKKKFDKCCPAPKNVTRMTLVNDTLFLVGGDSKLYKIEPGAKKCKKITGNSTIKNCFELLSCKGQLFSLFHDGSFRRINPQNAFGDMVAGGSQRTTLKKLVAVSSGLNVMFGIDKGGTFYKMDEKGMARSQMNKIKVWGSYIAGGNNEEDLFFIDDKGQVVKRMSSSSKKVASGFKCKRPQGISVVGGMVWVVESGELYGIDAKTFSGKPKKVCKLPVSFRIFGY